MPARRKLGSLGEAVAFAIGAVVFLLAVPFGRALARTVGVAFIVSALIAWVVYAVGARRLPQRLQPFAGGLATIAGIMLGRLVLLLLAAPALWVYWALDAALLCPGILWLCWRPGMAPVLYVGAYVLLTVALNLPTLTSGSGPAFRAAVTSTVLWVLALLLLFRGLKDQKTSLAGSPGA